MGLITWIQIFEHAHTATCRHEAETLRAGDNYLLKGLVAPDHVQQVAVGIEAQRTTQVVGTRILIDHQHILAATHQGGSKVDHSSGLARTRTPRSDGDNAQGVGYQQAAQPLGLVLYQLSQGKLRSYPGWRRHV